MAEEQTQEVKADEAPPKKKRHFFRMLLIVLITFATGGGVLYYFYGDTLMAYYFSENGEAPQKKKAEVGPLLTLEPFIINISGNVSPLVKISLAVELKDPKAVEETKRIVPVVRDVVLSVLGPKAPQVFMNAGERSRLKKELSDSIAGLLKQDMVRAVYITDIVVQ